MRFDKWSKIVPFVVLLTISIAACAGSPLTPTPTPARSAPTYIAERGDTQWDLVVLGDSILWGFTAPYAALLEQDLRVDVVPHDRTSSNLASQDLLDRLRSDQELRDLLGEAEVIVIHVPRQRFAACAGFEEGTLRDCLPSAVQQYNADVTALFAELVAIRSPSEALIRTMDAYSHWPIPEARERGVQTIINEAWSQANEHLAAVAAQYQIPVALVYAAFNGPSGEQDPVAAGVMGVDGRHTTPQGAALIAQLVRDLGYNYGPPP